MKQNRWMSKLLIWRLKHVSDKNFVLILSGLVGAVSGIAAVALKATVHYIDHALTGGFSIDYQNYLYFAYPLAGIALTYIVAKFFFKEKLGHGITSILYAISKGSSHLKRRMMVSRMITSALTVGFGGSVGLEAPIVVTGSAIGANMGKEAHLHYKLRTLMIGCGSSAAIAAMFNSPIAGVIFSVEVLLAEVTISRFVPLLIASVSGSLISNMLLGDDILFRFNQLDLFQASDVPFYIGLGVFCGLVATYFTKTVYFIESKMASVTNEIKRLMIGGVVLGVMIFVLPPMYGEGYKTIKLLISGDATTILNNSLFYSFSENVWFILLFMGGLILLKGIAASVTIGAGGSGGVFAPSLFIGGISGYFFALLSNQLQWTKEISTTNFTLVGMCGVMSAVLHAPLTAIFLIAEITGGYTLFVPLMLVSAIAYSTIYYFEPHSIYTKHLHEKGDLITQKDKIILSLLDIKKLIEKDFQTVHPDASLGELIEEVKTSRRNLFPVVNTECRLVGLVHLDDIRKIMFDPSKYSILMVKTLMKEPNMVINVEDSMQDIIDKFESSNEWNLPVVNGDDIYIGIYSKAKLFAAYRKRMARHDKDVLE